MRQHRALLYANVGASESITAWIGIIPVAMENEHSRERGAVRCGL